MNTFPWVAHVCVSLSLSSPLVRPPLSTESEVAAISRTGIRSSVSNGLRRKKEREGRERGRVWHFI